MRWIALSLVLLTGCGVANQDSVTSKCAGLWTQGSPLSAPEGALAVAENAVLSEDDEAELRRGICPVATRALTRLFPFKAGLVGWGSDAASYSADGVSWSSIAGSYPAPSGAPVRAAEAGTRLLVTGATGIRRMTSLSSVPEAAGMPEAPGLASSIVQFVANAQGILAANASVAYRVVWGKRIGNYTLLGEPSGRGVMLNNSGATANPRPVILAPPGVDGSYFYQLYRSEVAPSGQTPSDEMALVSEALWPAVAARAISIQRSGGGVVTVTTDIAHGLAGAVGSNNWFWFDPGNSSFPGLVLTSLIDTPTATTFRYSQAGAATGAVTVSAAIERLTYNPAADATPDTLRQATLYTSPSQEGSLAGNARPPLARDVVAFRGAAIYANLTFPAALELAYLGGLTSGGPGINITDGIGAGQTFFPGVDFAVSTTGVPSVDLRDTMLFFCDAVNRARPALFRARYASSDTDAPGKIVITALSPLASVVFYLSSGGGSFSTPNGTRQAAGLGTQFVAAPPANPAGIAWSKQDQPEAVPSGLALVPKIVGSADKAVLRAAPTRDSVFLFKDGEGTYRLSGETPDTFRIDPFDPNCHLVAPESAVALDNKVLMLTEQGVVAVTDTGVELVSRAIEPSLKALLTPTMRPVTKALAFGIAYESERKYILFAPSAPTDTACTQAFVLDLIAFARTGSGWTHWAVSAAGGLVNPADDRLYLVDGSYVLQERKSGTELDYADEAYAATITTVATDGRSVQLLSVDDVQVGDALDQGGSFGIVTSIVGFTVLLDRATGLVTGAATIYRAISFALEWLPKFAPPGKLHHFIESALQFRRASFAAAQVGFATDMDPARETIQVTTGWQGIEQSHPSALVTIPRNKARGAHLRIRVDMAQAFSPVAVEALTVAYSPGTASVRPRAMGAGMAAPLPLDVVPLV